MQMHWWQSIRWRLALGSVTVVLIATAVMALSAILAIAYYYNSEQQTSLQVNAGIDAQAIGSYYVQKGGLGAAVNQAFSNRVKQPALPVGLIEGSHGEDYLFLVYNRSNHLVYPSTRQIAQLNQKNQNPWKGLMQNAASRIRAAVRQVQQNKSTVLGELGGRYFVDLIPRSFIAVPLTAGGKPTDPIVGVLLMTPKYAANNTLPDFVTKAGKIVLEASLVVAVLAALAAILFARTITRPLARVTAATRVLTSGDYSARVSVSAAGEVGELAHNFNDMAAQLQRDVEELRKQELWRRELIMSITHDLATPLTAIAGLGEALADGVSQSREDYEETGRVIVRETLRLRRLVKDLHMMAKVEAGALIPQRRPVRLAALVDEALAVLITEFERAQVEPRNMLAYTLPHVEADPDMLTRVFSNLCDNALQHTPPGGSISIEANPYNGMLAVAVTDTGKGIPPEALERVFERFFRADTARQSKTGGSGLGLAIVRAIVEAHGGRVWAENAEGAGARFIFTLPLAVAGSIALSDETTLRLPKRKLHY